MSYKFFDPSVFIARVVHSVLTNAETFGRHRSAKSPFHRLFPSSGVLDSMSCQYRADLYILQQCPKLPLMIYS